jgi:hypothetical protein
MQRKTLWALALCLCWGQAVAGPRDVRVLDAWARATPPMATVAGGYLTVANDSAADDRLLRIESKIAKRIEIHEMRNDGGVMRMRQISDGLPLPAHGQLALKPGGYHLMLMGPAHALVAGETFKATLVFEHAGKLPATFTVRALGADGG